MPARSKYQHYNLKQGKRQTLDIAAFGGVDFSNQKLQVSSHRAVDLINFIYKDGVIQKREGYTQRAYAPTVHYIEYPYDGSAPTTTILENTSKRFNGIWHFLADDGQFHTIAHIGEVLFEITDLEGKVVHFKLLSSTGKAVGSDAFYYDTTYRHLDQKSMAFVGNNKLWFLGGNKYMIIGFRAGDSQLIYEPVEESSLAYIPTTTISITYANSEFENARTGLEYANTMTMWRQNTCLSGTGKKADDPRRTKFYEYQLDAPLVLKNTESDVAALQQNKAITSISLDTLKEISKIRINVEEMATEEEE